MILRMMVLSGDSFSLTKSIAWQIPSLAFHISHGDSNMKDAINTPHAIDYLK
jgi:hypothetical protein